MHQPPFVWLVMGVSGSGKTSVGRCLADRLDCDFWEGDRRHSVANIAKMAAGVPLEDSDRQQWLSTITADIQRAIANRQEVVVTCSGLKQRYRQQLTAVGRVQLVWLDIPKAILERRLAERPNHYMSARMLDSQLEAFEPLQPEEQGFQLDGLLSLDAIVDGLLRQAIARYPSLTQPWWERTAGHLPGAPAEEQDL